MPVSFWRFTEGCAHMISFHMLTSLAPYAANVGKRIKGYGNLMLCFTK